MTSRISSSAAVLQSREVALVVALCGQTAVDRLTSSEKARLDEYVQRSVGNLSDTRKQLVIGYYGLTGEADPQKDIALLARRARVSEDEANRELTAFQGAIRGRLRHEFVALTLQPEEKKSDPKVA